MASGLTTGLVPVSSFPYGSMSNFPGCPRLPVAGIDTVAAHAVFGETLKYFTSQARVGGGYVWGMDWGVYWFMFPGCILIAAVATFSGISGAALLTPVFLIGFPLMRVPELGTAAAIGTSLFLEAAGFGAGVFRYLRLRLADLSAVRSLVALTLPAGVLGAVLGEHVPGQWLRIGYGAAMLGVAWLIGSTGRKTVVRRPDRPCPCLVCESECSDPECAGPDRRSVRAADGQRYDYCASGMGWQRVFSGAGAVLAGMISTGVGEATLPTLVRRSRFPVPVAAATSTLVVAGTVVGAAATHLIQLTASGGLAAIPWNLIVWAVPGAVLGALAGTRLQGRVSEKLTRRFFSMLFVGIGLAFLMAFTVFNGAFNAR